jgi:hypothetical protein
MTYYLVFLCSVYGCKSRMFLKIVNSFLIERFYEEIGISYRGQGTGDRG